MILPTAESFASRRGGGYGEAAQHPVVSMRGGPVVALSAIGSAPHQWVYRLLQVSRLRQADRVAGDRAVGEELAHLVDGGVREGQDVVRGHELIVRHRLPRCPHEGHG